MVEHLAEVAQQVAGPLQAIIDRGGRCPVCGSELVLCVPSVDGTDGDEPVVALECSQLHNGPNSHDCELSPCDWEYVDPRLEGSMTEVYLTDWYWRDRD